MLYLIKTNFIGQHVLQMKSLYSLITSTNYIHNSLVMLPNTNTQNCLSNQVCTALNLNFINKVIKINVCCQSELQCCSASKTVRDLNKFLFYRNRRTSSLSRTRSCLHSEVRCTWPSLMKKPKELNTGCWLRCLGAQALTSMVQLSCYIVW